MADIDQLLDDFDEAQGDDDIYETAVRLAIHLGDDGYVRYNGSTWYTEDFLATAYLHATSEMEEKITAMRLAKLLGPDNCVRCWGRNVYGDEWAELAE